MKKGFTTPKRGFVVKGDKLYEFRRDWVAVSKAWPPVRYEKTRKRPYWHYSPVDKMSYSYFSNKYSACESRGEPFYEDSTCLPPDWPPKWMPALAKFYEGVPLDVRDVMLSCGDKPDGTPWNICAFFARCREAGDIMRNSPAIGFMLANLPVFRKGVKRRWDVVRRLVGRQRREILGHLGWPECESMAKILSRIPIDACTKRNLLMLRALVKRQPEIIKPLSHIKRISPLSLDVLCRRRHREAAGWRLVAEMGDVVGSEGYFDIYTLFTDTLRMEKMIGTPARQIKSMEHLRRRHDRAVDLMNKMEMSKAANKGWFPPPPVAVPPPTHDFEIIPIDDPLKLCQEGIEQHNCVSSYSDDIARRGGDVYIYSMIRPERATLMIEKMDGRRGYFIAEMKGPCNKDVAGSTVDAARRWLDAFSEADVSSNLYDALVSTNPLPTMNVPSVDGVEASQMRDPRELVAILAEFGVRIDNSLMNNIIKGRLFGFSMNEPDEGLLLVSRDGKGGLTYTPYLIYGRLGYVNEKLIDNWIARLEELNFPTDGPGQIWFDFGYTAAGKDLAHSRQHHQLSIN